MRCGRFWIIVLGAWMLSGEPPVRAGVYISTEVRFNDFNLNTIKLLRSNLQLLALPIRPNDPEKLKYQKLLTELETREKAGNLTAVDRADLGGIYLRLGRPRDAARVLSAGDTGHFLVLCNLAVADHELAVQDLDINRLEEAVLNQKKALAVWPTSWSGWTDEQWYFYRRVERLHLRLLEVRFRELRSNDGKPPTWQTFDDLFPGFKPIGPSGSYEAGQVALPMLDLLPPDAPWQVRELMMAYPMDARLYWLFGELLNTSNRVEDALQVFSDLVDANQASNIRDLMTHRRILLERARLLRELRETQMFGNDKLLPLAQEDILWALAPRSLLPMPGAGPVAVEAGWWATTAAIEQLQKQERVGRSVLAALPALPPADPQPEKKESPQSTRPVSPLPDWRVFFVGFAAGVVITLVVGLQRSEWKRRRQAAIQQSMSHRLKS